MDNSTTKAMMAGHGVEAMGSRARNFDGLVEAKPKPEKAGDASGATGAEVTGKTFLERLQAAQVKKPLTQEEARKVAGDLVSNALIMPVLKQIRRDPFGQNTIFSAGKGEKAFGPEFDMQLADRIAHSPKMTVTDALANRLVTRGQVKTQGPAKQSDEPKIGSGVDVHG